MAENKRATQVNESASRGQTMRTETGPEREDKVPQVNNSEALKGTKLAGDGNTIGGIEGAKVKRY